MFTHNGKQNIISNYFFLLIFVPVHGGKILIWPHTIDFGLDYNFFNFKTKDTHSIFLIKLFTY